MRTFTTVHLTGEDIVTGAVRVVDNDPYGLLKFGGDGNTVTSDDPDTWMALASTCRDIAIQLQAAHEHRLPVYRPTGLVLGGVEMDTGRLACCGAGPDRDGEHLPGCQRIAAAAIAECRRILDPDHDITPADVRDAEIDAGRWGAR